MLYANYTSIEKKRVDDVIIILMGLIFLRYNQGWFNPYSNKWLELQGLGYANVICKKTIIVYLLFYIMSITISKGKQYFKLIQTGVSISFRFMTKGGRGGRGTCSEDLPLILILCLKLLSIPLPYFFFKVALPNIIYSLYMTLCHTVSKCKLSVYCSCYIPSIKNSYFA